MNELFTNA